MTILDRIRNETGQVLPLVALMAVVLIGFVGLAVDMGRVWVTRQQLQRAVDASALVASQDLPNTSTGYSAAVAYSGTGSANSVGGWGVTTTTPSVTFECAPNGPDYTAGSSPTCLTDTSGDYCHPAGSNAPAATTCNAVNVTESATVKTGLLSMFIPKFTVTASSTAAARGIGVPNPMNLFVILDTTNSMSDACSATVTGISSPHNPDKLDCAKAGVRAMLQALTPCSTSLSSCGSDVSNTTNVSNPIDEVGMLVFPAISLDLTPQTTTTGTGSHRTTTTTYGLGSAPQQAYLNYETDCSSSSTHDPPDTYPPYEPYTYSATATDGIPLGDFSTYDNPSGDFYVDDYPGYEAVPLSSDYRSADSSTTLNTSSSLVESVYWGQCSNGNYPGGDYYGLKQVGGQGSYLAGAITEAQYLLSQAPARTGPNGQAATNAIVILSDGEINDPKSSSDGVAPGEAGNVGWSDNTPCEDADQAATASKSAGTLIFSIAYDSSGNCTDTGSGGMNVAASTLMQDLASNSQDYFSQSTAGDLTTIFSEVGTQLSGDSRLIPDCTQLPPNC
ncbi:MAG TPA: pilus assembly protein TadG-related protein [Solirubrobacteraceae bacterium]|jgi:Flp pilus assembly protein TadG|nr:pilus assembly protein TadG-related protein [Solirubrobacteraceae bacterium]